MKKDKEIAKREAPKRVISLLDKKKFHLHKITGKTILASFGGNEDLANQHMAGVTVALMNDEKLQGCDTNSIASCIVKSATLGVDVSGVTGEGYMLPFWDSKSGVFKAQLIIGYKGYVKLLYDAGIDAIHADIVHEKDKATYINGQFVHEIDIRLSKAQRGKEIGAYVSVINNGKTMSKYMNMEDIMAHAKKFSKTYNQKSKSFVYSSPWNDDKDPEGGMKKKTVLFQLVKYLPKTKKINLAMANDNSVDSKIVTDAEKRRIKAFEESDKLRIGNLNQNYHEKNKELKEGNEKPEQEAQTSTEG